MGLIARLFWEFPEPFHSIVGRLTGGWRVVSHDSRQYGRDATDPKQLYRWERWPYSPEYPAGRRQAKDVARPW